MKTQEEKQIISKYQQRRIVLISISVKLRKLRQYKIDTAKTAQDALFWSSRTINDLLMMHLYNKKGDKKFHTFRQWKKEGFTVKKGAKAVTVWGQPTVGTKENNEKKNENKKGEKQESDDCYEFFPICYLFSSDDVVDTRLKSQEQPVKEPEQEKEPTFII